MGDFYSKQIYVLHVGQTAIIVTEETERPKGCVLAYEDSVAVYLVKSYVSRISESQLAGVRNCVINKSIELGVSSTLRDVRSQRRKLKKENRQPLTLGTLPLFAKNIGSDDDEGSGGDNGKA